MFSPVSGEPCSVQRDTELHDLAFVGVCEGQEDLGRVYVWVSVRFWGGAYVTEAVDHTWVKFGSSAVSIVRRDFLAG